MNKNFGQSFVLICCVKLHTAPIKRVKKINFPLWEKCDTWTNLSEISCKITSNLSKKTIDYISHAYIKGKVDIFSFWTFNISFLWPSFPQFLEPIRREKFKYFHLDKFWGQLQSYYLMWNKNQYLYIIRMYQRVCL